MYTICDIYVKDANGPEDFYDADMHAVRIISPRNKFVYDVKLADTGIRTFPVPGKYAVIWLHDQTSEPDSFRLQEPGTVQVGKLRLAPGFGILVNTTSMENPDLYSESQAEHLVGSSHVSANNMTWISAQADEYGHVTSGIGVSLDGSSIILKSNGAEIVLGNDGILLGGKQVVHSTEGERNSSITIKNPLHDIIPHAFFLPVSFLHQLPDIGLIMRTVQLTQGVSKLIGLL